MTRATVGLALLTGACMAKEFDDSSAFRFTSFEAAWATPNAIRWRFVTEGEFPDRGEYRLHIADEETLADEATVRTIDRLENAELGYFELELDTSTPRTVRVDATTSDRLLPSTAYWARVAVYVDGEPQALSPVAMQQTAPPWDQSRQAIILGDLQPPFASPPFVVETIETFNGTPLALRFELMDSDPWKTIFFGPEMGSNSIVPSQSQIDAFYLEMAVKSSSLEPTPYAVVSVSQGTDDNHTRGFGLRSNGEWVLYQIPLRELGSELSALNPLRPEVAISTFGITARWPAGSTVLVDEVSLKCNGC